jgi:hypothetical protein
MKITMPLAQIVSTGGFTDFYDDLIKVQSDLTITKDDDNVFIVDSMQLTITEINEILSMPTSGGEIAEVEEYLMAIRADVDILTDNVPIVLPNSQTFTNIVRTFENWFDSTCELWANAVDIASATQVYLLTNPLGTTQAQYLKGSEIMVLFNSFGGPTPSVVDRNLLPRTIAQFNDETASGWYRIN